MNSILPDIFLLKKRSFSQFKSIFVAHIHLYIEFINHLTYKK